MKPLYMWAGGKKKMIPKYLEFPGIPLEGYDTFVEPFFGGGAMTIWMLENNPNLKKIVINDVKSELMGIYYAIQKDLASFEQRMDYLDKKYILLNKTDRKKFYYDLRHEYTKDWRKWSPTDSAATLYFLMKTGFNGIWQVNQADNPDKRFSTPVGLVNHKESVYDKKNVRLWHEVLKIVEVHNGSWQDVCDQDRAFYFFDPPYRDSFTTYGAEFDDNEHIELLEFCQTANSNGNLIFYCNRDDNNDVFFDQHRGTLSKTHYDITYTAGRRKQVNNTFQAKGAKEVLIYSPQIMPKTSVKQKQEEVFGSMFSVRS